MINLIRKDFYLLRGAMFTWIVAYIIFYVINSSSAVLRYRPRFHGLLFACLSVGPG